MLAAVSGARTATPRKTKRRAWRSVMQKAVRERQSTPPGSGGRSIVTQMNKQVKISRRRRDSVGFCRVRSLLLGPTRVIVGSVRRPNTHRPRRIYVLTSASCRDNTYPSFSKAAAPRDAAAFAPSTFHSAPVSPVAMASMISPHAIVGFFTSGKDAAGTYMPVVQIQGASSWQERPPGRDSARPADRSKDTSPTFSPLGISFTPPLLSRHHLISYM